MIFSDNLRTDRLFFAFCSKYCPKKINKERGVSCVLVEFVSVHSSFPCQALDTGTTGA